MYRLLLLVATLAALSLTLTSCINLPTDADLGAQPVISVKPVGEPAITENGAQPNETAQPVAEQPVADQPIAEGTTSIDVSQMAGAGPSGQVHWQVHVL